MENSELVTLLLEEQELYPAAEPEKPGGLCLSLKDGQLTVQGTALDLIDLADLLVSLALSGKAQGQHWHVDNLTLMDSSSEIPELILSRK